ncbi:uncharacterized protein TM35_000092050 [Trypanosoma theileri]|uniref:Uncharacterized protein n=1 Tax=Trypanosoma theileri TaxID=67003 RepID=A0A1X0NZP9_9TRYP|nr:uncharacterized protein TM35_000092050 [Trypanosoma theileri]ORC90155.1 hypothetical protein TM35_000092050 [Trypanosoma theileri]
MIFTLTLEVVNARCGLYRRLGVWWPYKREPGDYLLPSRAAGVKCVRLFGGPKEINIFDYRRTPQITKPQKNSSEICILGFASMETWMGIRGPIWVCKRWKNKGRNYIPLRPSGVSAIFSSSLRTFPWRKCCISRVAVNSSFG